MVKPNPKSLDAQNETDYHIGIEVACELIYLLDQ